MLHFCACVYVLLVEQLRLRVKDVYTVCIISRQQSSTLCQYPHPLTLNPMRCCCVVLLPLCVQGYDFFQSVTKLRQVGFNSMRLDSTDMWLGWLKHLDTQGLFPPLLAVNNNKATAGAGAGAKVVGGAEAPAAPAQS